MTKIKMTHNKIHQIWPHDCYETGGLGEENSATVSPAVVVVLIFKDSFYVNETLSTKKVFGSSPVLGQFYVFSHFILIPYFIL